MKLYLNCALSWETNYFRYFMMSCRIKILSWREFGKIAACMRIKSTLTFCHNMSWMLVLWTLIKSLDVPKVWSRTSNIWNIAGCILQFKVTQIKFLFFALLASAQIESVKTENQTGQHSMGEFQLSTFCHVIFFRRGVGGLWYRPHRWFFFLTMKFRETFLSLCTSANNRIECIIFQQSVLI